MSDYSDIDMPASLKEMDDKGGVSKVWGLKGKNTFRIGRASGNDITLPYSWVSRKHTMVQNEGNGHFSIFDLGSSNGTFINGRRISGPTPLKTGDCITIGKTMLEFFQNTDLIPQASEHDATLDRTVAFLQREIITLLICDIRNFTMLSEKIGNQQISNLLRYWTEQVSSIVNKNNGMVDKFIGDAVMAMWAGGENYENINNALKTAMLISEMTRTLGRKLKNMPWDLEIGAALNTGEAVIGNMGVEGYRDYTVIGDVVNVTFRLEELTDNRGVDVIMGRDTAGHIENVEKYFTANSYRLKGKEEDITAYVCSFRNLDKYLKNS